jgi:hypothetical protein
MTQELPEAIPPAKARSLAGTFFRLGWAGFWLQVVFGSLPILGLAYYLTFSIRNPDVEGGFGFMEVLAILNLLLLLFTTWWSFGYTRIARELRDPEKSVSQPYVIRTVWTGVVATTTGMLLSMVAILIETARVLAYFMKAPQGGVPVIQTGGAASPHFVTTFDLMCLMALVLFLCAEMIVLVFGLWLLFRTLPGAPDAQPAPIPAEAPTQEPAHQTPT